VVEATLFCQERQVCLSTVVSCPNFPLPPAIFDAPGVFALCRPALGIDDTAQSDHTGYQAGD